LGEGVYRGGAQAMKKLKAALICASLFVPLSEAIADDFSGVKLYQYCNNPTGSRSTT
jgi:hypothetical protein